MNKKLQIISLISYSAIILMGEMIGIPFLIWLFYTSFDFASNGQLEAIIGLTGFILNFTKYIKPRFAKIISFCLMITPLISRLIEVPIEKFNYLSFQIPLLIFVVLYLIMIFRPIENKHRKEVQN